MRSRLALPAVFAILFVCPVTAALGSDECRVAVLSHAEAGPSLEMVPVPANEPLLFESGEIITVVLPFGVGMSGDLIRSKDAGGTFRVVCVDGELRVTSLRPDGSEHELPPVSVADLAGYDMRVNVTAGDGSKKAFLIHAYRDVETDDGPVVDMFAGAAPMGPGDYSITTEVSRHERPPSISGEIPLVLTEGLLLAEGEVHDGSPGWFVVDFGAGATVVSREFLPSGASVEDVVAVEHSREGSRILPGSMTGAGGDVGGFLGSANLEKLSLGSVVLSDVPVLVVEGMPDFGDLNVSGILGLDVLGRGGIASLTLGEDDRATLVLGGSGPAGAAANAIEVPFTMAADHIFVQGGIGGVPVSFLFDTGARATILPRSLADAAGLGPGSLPDREFRGLDGAPLPARSVRADDLTLGGVALPALEMYAADLPVLERFGLDEGSGLLGIGFVLTLDRLDVDFARGVLRLWGAAP